MKWEIVIGLEVHAQLKTNSKLFSTSPTEYGQSPNTQASFIDAGFPGVLPVLNRHAVELAVRFGLAINATINDYSFFERKNYFYPDLPKGYQISQFQRPIVSNGILENVIIDRAHLEEDAGKSSHDIQSGFTGIDLNRAGIPLLEIVTAPCIHSAAEAIAYLKTLHQLLRFLDICDGNMQEGSFRCDVNLSLRPLGSKPLGTRTELKNLNSFRFIEKAISVEVARHQDLLESNQRIEQETRSYCPDTNTTRRLRGKENENDYRYFPDPDLLPIHLDAECIESIKANMPPLPNEIKTRLQNEDKLSDLDIEFLCTSLPLFHYYEQVKTQSKAPPKTIANWLKGPYSAAMHELGQTFETPSVSALDLAILLDRLTDQIIPMNLAKSIFSTLLSDPKPIDDIIQSSGYKASSNDSVIRKIIETLLKQYPDQAAEYRAGKEKILSFFVGLVMKETKGQADPVLVNKLLKKQF